MKRLLASVSVDTQRNFYRPAEYLLVELTEAHRFRQALRGVS